MRCVLPSLLQLLRRHPLVPLVLQKVTWEVPETLHRPVNQRKKSPYLLVPSHLLPFTAHSSPHGELCSHHRTVLSSPLESQTRERQCVESVAEVVEGARAPMSSVGLDMGWTRVIEDLLQGGWRLCETYPAHSVGEPAAVPPGSPGDRRPAPGCVWTADLGHIQTRSLPNCGRP